VSACAVMTPPSPRESVCDGGTLDELITALWEGLEAHRTVACPVCAAEMKPTYGAHARSLGGRCASCGSELR
jgi:hypothetical protein